jgi:tetratricopeptide (TPR) repeat protein
MATDCLITLTIKEAPATAGKTFLYHVDVDGQPIVNNQGLPVEYAQDMRDLASAYGELFEQHLRPELTDETLNAVGARLFDLWLGKSWDKIKAKFTPGCRRWLVIASEAAEILNLPWELLRPAGEEAIGADVKWTLRRVPWVDRALPAHVGELRPPPLRILFMACSPTDQHELDYEREEKFLLDAIARIGPGAVYDSSDLGTYDDLQQKINVFDPHIVHLMGHGAVVNGVGNFVFESEAGASDRKSSAEIGQLFAGSNVQCAFISGCQTGKAPDRAALGGVCQGLVREGVPIAIGWAASIADHVANELARVFYQTAATGQPIDRALAQGRQAARKLCEQRGDPSWTLPVLYAGSRQAGVFDPGKKPEKPARPSLRLQALPGMTAGYAEHFIGRRREQQRLFPALKEGNLQAIVLTGLGGAGKSTLATRLTRKLEAESFSPIAVSGTHENPHSVAGLLESCRTAFLKAGLKDAYDVLQQAEIPVGDRLNYLVATLNDQRFVLVLDNFEVNLDETTKKIRDPELAGFYRHLIQALSGGSRVIITSRYLPAGADPLPATLWHEEPVGDFPEAAFLKYMLRDPVVERRYYQLQLPGDLVRRLHRLLGGTPRFMAQIREVLQTIDKEDLARELDAVEQGLPQDASLSRLQDARDRYCEDIFTGRLYGALPDESRAWLSRAAVFAVPVPLAGFAAAAGAPVEALRAAAETWQRSALAYPEVARGDLWSIYGTLRGWLTAPTRLPADQRRAAQEAAGDYLVEMERQDREGELGLSWVDCLLEARALYLAAGALEQAREVTDRISGVLVRRGLYGEIEHLGRELVELEEHPDPLMWVARSLYHRGDLTAARDWYARARDAAGDDERARATALASLASADVAQGNYPGARQSLEEARKALVKIGERAGEAATRHELATIDLNEGNYPAARERTSARRSRSTSRSATGRARRRPGTSWPRSTSTRATTRPRGRTSTSRSRSSSRSATGRARRWPGTVWPRSTSTSATTRPRGRTSARRSRSCSGSATGRARRRPGISLDGSHGSRSVETKASSSSRSALAFSSPSATLTRKRRQETWRIWPNSSAMVRSKC